MLYKKDILYIFAFLALITNSFGQCPAKFYDGNGQASDSPVWQSCHFLASEPDSYTLELIPVNSLTDYVIDFGDGSPVATGSSLAAGVSLFHTYNNLGSYEVTITCCGCPTPTIGKVNNSRPPTAVIIGPTVGGNVGCAPHMIPFKNDSYNVDEQTTFTWDFGDGTILHLDHTNAGQTINHIYQRESSDCGIVVMLTARNSCDSFVTTWSPVNIYDIDTAIIEPSYTLLCTSDRTATFHNNSNLNCVTGSRSEFWDMGDGTSYGWQPALGSVTHTFPGPGIYSVSMIDSNACGPDIAYALVEIVENLAIVTQKDSTLEATRIPGASYQWVDCLNGYSHIPGEINRFFSPATSGTYAVIIKSSSCTDTSDCHKIVIFERGVYGTIFNDINQNCLINAGENGLENRRLTISPGNIVTQTNASGLWYIDSLPAGSYTAIIDTSGNWVPTCQGPITFTISDPNLLLEAPVAGLISTTSCASPDVSVFAPFIRRCFSDQNVHVKVCNLHSATASLDSAFLDIQLDTLLTPEIPLTDLGNNTFRLKLDTLMPGKCSDFIIPCTVSCDAVLNQTLCIEASIKPVDSCLFNNSDATTPLPGSIACNTQWDKSSLQVSGSCNQDTVVFTIQNTGIGNMTCYSQVRLFVDGELIKIDSVMLAGQESKEFIYSGDGRTMRLEADQHYLHPHDSRPNATIESCGNIDNWTSNLVTILPSDDIVPVKDIFCSTVTGSYDPNDKTGYPLGIGEHHGITPNTPLEYVIRFQNTGTDTAFTVIIKDTLDPDLDIFSVIPGASSHNYSFRMYGPRILEWTFNEIMLPDSTTDEPGSNGFVAFKVQQKRDLQNGTVLSNSSSIYFDFNDPIITNTTIHTINDGINIKDWSSEELITASSCVAYHLNGYDYTNAGSYFQKIKTDAGNFKIVNLQLEIENINVTVAENGSTLTAESNSEATYQWVNCTSGYSIIPNETSVTFSPSETGYYAVIAQNNSCSDTSDCHMLTISGINNSLTRIGGYIFPNPGKSNVKLILNESIGNGTIRIMNLTGQVVDEKSYKSGKTFDLEISQLVNGIYVVELISHGQIQRYKLIKN